MSDEISEKRQKFRAVLQSIINAAKDNGLPFEEIQDELDTARLSMFIHDCFATVGLDVNEELGKVKEKH